ncbi:MAG: hypothetical protein K8R85_00990 [Bacteroidetes bacterium]|nr:hypothetical protein [Bacteroidota bacterium]
MIKVPANYSRCGIKVKCSKCKWTVSDTCRLTNNGIKTCQFKNKHKYIMIVHVPKTKTKKRMKMAKSQKFDEVLIEYVKFKEMLARDNYRKDSIKKRALDTTMPALMKDYLNSISGSGSHEHLSRNLSVEYVRETKMVLLKFCKVLKAKGYIIETMDLKEIGDDEVEHLHAYLTKKPISASHYSKHFVVMKTFVNWVIRVKRYEIINVFKSAKLSFGKQQKNWITQEEFSKLIEVTTAQNSVRVDKSGKKRYFYHSWLPAAFKIGLETGLRREEIMLLKWSNIREIIIKGNTCRILNINNLKVNRIMFSTDNGKYEKPIPITMSLQNLLIELGYEIKKNTDDYILERDPNMSTKYLMNELTRGFAHFIKYVTNRKIEFKDLRKTYISYLSLKLGDKTKMFTGHGDDQVIRDHYIAEAFIAANLSDFNLFD